VRSQPKSPKPQCDTRCVRQTNVTHTHTSGFRLRLRVNHPRASNVDLHRGRSARPTGGRRGLPSSRVVAPERDFWHQKIIRATPGTHTGRVLCGNRAAAHAKEPSRAISGPSKGSLVPGITIGIPSAGHCWTASPGALQRGLAHPRRIAHCHQRAAQGKHEWKHDSVLTFGRAAACGRTPRSNPCKVGNMKAHKHEWSL
jgi:hypothetical protein